MTFLWCIATSLLRWPAWNYHIVQVLYEVIVLWHLDCLHAPRVVVGTDQIWRICLRIKTATELAFSLSALWGTDFPGKSCFMSKVSDMSCNSSMSLRHGAETREWHGFLKPVQVVSMGKMQVWVQVKCQIPMGLPMPFPTRNWCRFHILTPL